jgi:hypothetical protein
MMLYVSVPSSHVCSILVSTRLKPIRTMMSRPFWHYRHTISSGVIPSMRGLIPCPLECLLVMPSSCVTSSLSALPDLVQLLASILLCSLSHDINVLVFLYLVTLRL